MTHDDIHDRDDAQLAQYQRRTPGVFARLLALLTPPERAVMRERLRHGQAKLREYEAEQQREREMGGER